MPAKIKITPGQPVGLKLTPDEREAVLALPWRDEALRARTEEKSVDQQSLMLTLAELGLLAESIGAEAKHIRDLRIRKKLDRILDRIAGVRGMFEEG